MATAAISNEPIEPTPEERLSLAAEQIAAAVERLHKGRLNERALILLIHDSCEQPKPNLTMIRNVLNAVKRLPQDHLIQEKKK